METSNKIISFLKEKGWDGKYPIPITWNGKATVSELRKLLIIYSGDDHCLWAINAESAYQLLQRDHRLITDPAILKKRQPYLDNPSYKELYPWWYNK